MGLPAEVSLATYWWPNPMVEDRRNPPSHKPKWQLGSTVVAPRDHAEISL